MEVLGRAQLEVAQVFKLPWRGASPPNHHDDKAEVAQVSVIVFFFFITLKPRIE